MVYKSQFDIRSHLLTIMGSVYHTDPGLYMFIYSLYLTNYNILEGVDGTSHQHLYDTLILTFYPPLFIYIRVV